MKGSIITCIEGPKYIQSVARASAWIAEAIPAPILFLHVNEEQSDFAESRADLLFEQAASYFDNSIENRISKVLLHGNFLDNIINIQDDTRVLVVGRQGSHAKEKTLGSHVEEIIQSTVHPVFMVPAVFKIPQRVMIAFDGSEATVSVIDTIAQSALFKLLECHVVMVGAETDEHKEQLSWAKATLENAGIKAHSELLVETSIENALSDYATLQQIDLLVMSAYQHSKLWHYFIGSNTSKLLHRSDLATLILKE